MSRSTLVEFVLNIRGYFESCVLYNVLQKPEDTLKGILQSNFILKAMMVRKSGYRYAKVLTVSTSQLRVSS